MDIPGHPPGAKPAPFTGKPRKTDATRMIAPDHGEQIARLMHDYFGDAAVASAWLEKNFDVKQPRDLLTAKRAGQVIRVLKDMHARRCDGADGVAHQTVEAISESTSTARR